MITKNEMKFLVPCMPDRWNGIREQDEMIREGMGHAFAVPDTGNGTARSKMEMNVKMSVSPSCPRRGPPMRAGTFSRGWGGGSSLTRTPGPLLPNEWYGSWSGSSRVLRRPLV